MIETEQTALVDAGVDDVWNYVQDIARWAEIMPGYRECEIIDGNDSRWTLKVGVGGLVRTVKVLVHVDAWNGPDTAHFTYTLTGDPVNGGGTYRATPMGPGKTEIALKVHVVGSGPMAPMWEAMGAPLLPRFAKAFADQLRDEIEKSIGASDATVGEQPYYARLWQKILGLFRR
jgi:carbon monoxide dehydrogenase subunit G